MNKKQFYEYEIFWCQNLFNESLNCLLQLRLLQMKMLAGSPLASATVLHLFLTAKLVHHEHPALALHCPSVSVSHVLSTRIWRPSGATEATGPSPCPLRMLSTSPWPPRIPPCPPRKPPSPKRPSCWSWRHVAPKHWYPAFCNPLKVFLDPPTLSPSTSLR